MAIPVGKFIRTAMARLKVTTAFVSLFLLTAVCIPYAKALEEPKMNSESVGTELDGLVILQEGTHTRVNTPLQSYLVSCTPDALIKTYTHFSAIARERFGNRWRSFKGPNIDEEEFGYIVQGVTLTWIYYFAINNLPIKITDADWDEDSFSRNAIERVVQRRFPKGSKEATALCAHLMGVPESDYIAWRKQQDEIASHF
jgi:hypothetical protein